MTAKKVVKKTTKRKANPGVFRKELIYGRVLRMEAQKIGPHRCDAGCAKSNHCYYHDFKVGSNVHAYGMSDGSVLLIGSKRLWGMF